MDATFGVPRSRLDALLTSWHYHDWFAASFHHEFTLGGDLESAYAYYYAIRRINAIMREAVIELHTA